MKRIACFFVAALSLVMLFSSCGERKLGGKPGSSGKTLELMVVSKNSVYSGTTKDALDTIFNVPQNGLNQPESRFDMVQIAASSFENNTMFQSHRNILMLEVDPQSLNKVYLEYNKWATPQVVIRLTASDRESLDSMLLANHDRFLKEFYVLEYRRMDKIFSQTPDIKIINYVKEKYGYHLSIPEEFNLATLREESNFTWVLKQTKDFDLHLYLYSQPANGASDFEEATILNNLDTIMRRYVPGPSEGSYPGVERRDFFYTREVMLGDVKAVETRGLWRTYNDFMSGPFVCYTFNSPDGSRLLTLMGSVYSPSQRSKMLMKRDLLMQVDGICRSMKFEQ
jgi:hypothetical protein